MTADRIAQIRREALPHLGKNRSAGIIMELCDALEKTNHLYAMAIDSAFGSFKGKAFARKKLMNLVED